MFRSGDGVSKTLWVGATPTLDANFSGRMDVGYLLSLYGIAWETRHLRRRHLARFFPPVG